MQLPADPKHMYTAASGNVAPDFLWLVIVHGLICCWIRLHVTGNMCWSFLLIRSFHSGKGSTNSRWRHRTKPSPGSQWGRGNSLWADPPCGSQRVDSITHRVPDQTGQGEQAAICLTLAYSIAQPRWDCHPSPPRGSTLHPVLPQSHPLLHEANPRGLIP